MSVRGDYSIFSILLGTLAIISSFVFIYLQKEPIYSSSILIPAGLYVVISTIICCLLALFDSSVVRMDDSEIQSVADRVAALKASKSVLQSRKLNEINSFSVD